MVRARWVWVVLPLVGAIAGSCGLAETQASTNGFGGQTSSSTGGGASGGGGGVTFAGSGGHAGQGGASSVGGGTTTTPGTGGGAGAGGGAVACTPSDPGVCCQDDLGCGALSCCLNPDGTGLVCSDHCNGGLAPMPCDAAGDCSGKQCCAHWHHGPPGVFDGISCKTACVPPVSASMQDGDYAMCDVDMPDCTPPQQCVSEPMLGGARHGVCR